MNELQFGNKVRQALNEGTPLAPTTLAKLRAAREQALQRQRPVSAGGETWTDDVLTIFGGFGGFSLRLVFPAVMLVAGLFAINTWQTNQRVAEVEEIDAMLLADDLPLDAYLDKGFEAWLKKRSPL